MTRTELGIVILAAGKGTRLRSRRAKALHRAGGRALVEHVIRAAGRLGAPIFVVVGHRGEEVAAAVKRLGARTIPQKPQRGTGHALEAARRALRGFRRAIVLPGDAALVRGETLEAFERAHRESGATATVLAAMMAGAKGYERVVREPGGEVAAVVGEEAASEAERATGEIASGIYCFELQNLWTELGEAGAGGEHELGGVVERLKRRGERVAAWRAEDAEEVLGARTRAELAEADRRLRGRKIRELMAGGVTFYLPETTLVDADVEAGPDTIIEPGVELLGGTRLGVGVRVETGSVVADSVVEDEAEIRAHSVVAGSRVGRGAVVGPFAHLRDGAEIAAGARVGNYVEVKNSRLGEGSKAMHLSYLGDATIGRGTNIGAGTITCNYDGVRKNPTKIGARVFVGSGSELVAPVEIGDGAYVGAGSTITENVPRDALGIARARQENKGGWARERRARLAGKKAGGTGRGKGGRGRRKARAQTLRRRR